MLNKVTLIGNFGKDPEIRQVGSEGKKVANFTIATSESWRDKAGEKQTRTTWHNCNAWSPLAEIVEKYTQKGSMVYVEGKIVNSSYEQDGVTKYKSEIEVRELKLLSKKEDSGNSDSTAPAKEAGKKEAPIVDDIPF